MDKLLLHPRTAGALENIINNPMHAIGIEGQAGSGKKHLSKYIAANILDIPKIDDNPYILTIDCDSKIGIEEVRDSIKFLALKIPGDKAYKRCLIFWSFEMLSKEGQNALLKSLEEPPEDTLIIITTSSRYSLLSTTSSRLSWLSIIPVDLKSTLSYFAERHDEKRIKRAHTISNGNPGMMMNLLNDYDSQPLVQAIEITKQMLAKDRFDRVSEVDVLIKSKGFDPGLYLKALSKIFETTLKNQIDKNGTVNRKMLKALQKISSAQNSQSYNANQKLILTDVFYNL